MQSGKYYENIAQMQTYSNTLNTKKSKLAYAILFALLFNFIQSKPVQDKYLQRKID